MSDLIAMLGIPLIACLLMGSILSYLGIHVLNREVIFIDIAVAQVAAVGGLAAHIAFDAEESSLVAYLCSLVCVLLVSGFYSVARHGVTEMSIEAVIGISYAITAAGALFLIGIEPGDSHAHATEMLAGSLLWVTWPELLVGLIVFAAVGFVLWVSRIPMATVSQDYDAAQKRGMNVALWDFIFYALLGVVITVAVRLSGVVMVFALLIIPATLSALFTEGWLPRLALAWLAVVIASTSGLLLSYYHDFSMGPAIALCLGTLLAVLAALARLRAGNQAPSAPRHGV
jgi:zinc/manganese transport system permease protein